jgi:hypothetical protein
MQSHGFENNFQVKPEIVVEDVPGVQIDPFLINARVTAFAKDQEMNHEDAKDAKILYFFLIGTDNQENQSALTGNTFY